MTPPLELPAAFFQGRKRYGNRTAAGRYFIAAFDKLERSWRGASRERTNATTSFKHPHGPVQDPADPERVTKGSVEGVPCTSFQRFGDS